MKYYNEEFFNFKNKEAFEAKLDDAEYRAKQRGFDVKFSKEVQDNYHKSSTKAYYYYLWAIYKEDSETYSCTFAIHKLIADFEEIIKCYQWKISSVSIARFYALGIHCNLLRQLPYRKREATLMLIAERLNISGKRLITDFRKSEDLIKVGRLRVFEEAKDQVDAFLASTK